MKKINIGLDLGIGSVGWAVVNAEEFEILDAGSRIFNEANNKNISTTTLTRRENRSKRRGNRRDCLRRDDLIKLFIKNNFIKSKDDFDKLQLPKNKNVYEVRKIALDNKLTINELMIVLFSMLKHRGVFNLKDELIDEAKKAKKSIEEMEIKEEDQRFACEIQLDNLDKFGSVKGSQNKISHDKYKEELNVIFKTQENFGLISETFKNAYFLIFDRKREYYKGPGRNSSFGWKGEEEFYNRLIGKDTYDRNENRAPSLGIYANLFNLLNDLNNLTIKSPNHEELKLNYEEKKEIIDFIYDFGKKPKNLTLRELAKILKIQTSEITGYRINTEGQAIFTEFLALKEIWKRLTENNLSIDWLKVENNDLLDEIIMILTKGQSHFKRKKDLLELFEKKNLFYQNKEKISEVLAYLSFSGSHSMSNKTIKLVLDTMWHEPKNHQMIFSEMKIRPQYQFEIDATTKLVPIAKEQINEMYISPVAKRSFIQALKVLQEIQLKFGDSYDIQNIFIELAREKNSKDELEFLKNQQKLNETLNQEIKNYTLIGGKDLNKNLRKKLRFYIEQNGLCAYCFEPLDKSKVIDFSSYTEIDHIIPESILAISSSDNLVLVHSQENHEKDQKTPFNYFTSKNLKLNWDTFVWNVQNRLFNHYKSDLNEGNNDEKNLKKSIKPQKESNYIKRKIQNLLDERDYSLEKNRKEFINRNLNDTRTTTVAIKEYLEEYKRLSKSSFKIKTINGSFTHGIKEKYFALPKKDRDDFRHHAMDAIAIAYSDEFQNPSKVNKEYWESKRNEILKFDYRFSRMNKKNFNMQISGETIYSFRLKNDEFWKVEKLNLFEANKSDLEKFFLDKSDNVLMKNADPETFEFLKKIYLEYRDYSYTDKNGKERKVVNPFAYARDFEGIKITKKQNKKDPSKDPLVKTIKFYSEKKGKFLNLTHNYPLTKENKVVGLTNFNPIRIDIFKNKYRGNFKMLKLTSNLVQNANDDQKMQINQKEYNKYKDELGISNNYKVYEHLFPGDTLIFEIDGVTYIAILVGGQEKSNQLEIKYLHRNKRKEDVKDEFGNIKLKKDKPQIYKGLARITKIKKINLDVLGVKSSKYMLE